MSTKIDDRFMKLADAKKDGEIASLLEKKNTTGLLLPSLTRLVQAGYTEAKLLSVEPRVQSGKDRNDVPWVRVGCPIALEIDGQKFQFLRNIEGASLKEGAKLVLVLDTFTPEGQETEVTYVRAIESSFYESLKKADKQKAEATA